MKRITKGQVFAWVLALVPLILAAAVYSRLPEQPAEKAALKQPPAGPHPDAVGFRRRSGL